MAYAKVHLLTDLKWNDRLSKSMIPSVPKKKQRHNKIPYIQTKLNSSKEKKVTLFCFDILTKVKLHKWVTILKTRRWAHNTLDNFLNVPTTTSSIF